jgi:hypothetical protein
MKTKIVLTCCLLLCVLRARAQSADTEVTNAPSADTEGTHAGYVPVVSGSIGYVYNVDGGIPTLEPQINPVLLIPVGSHVLFESRTDFTGIFDRRHGTSGDYTGKVYKTVEFEQLDWLANTHIIPVAGRYILPFGLYAERLDPLWIANLQDIPLDFSIGTQTTGAGVGPQLRGVAVETPDFNVQYTAYYSVHNNVTQLQSSRTAGSDVSIYFNTARVELGTSYQRFLDSSRINNVNRQVDNEAVYLTWQPVPSTLDVKAEFDHSYTGRGYWIEGYSMLSSVPVATNFFRRMQLVGRDEQFVPLHGGGNGLPGIEEKRVEGGLNYYIRDDWRLISSYGRQFNSGHNFNLWNLGFTYRFVWPLGREKK